jgi:hypothetical protein
MTNFKRTISFNDPKKKYKSEEEEVYSKTLDNCHFGTIKLFYSELEFLLKCSRYINIDECLVLYIGAQPGYRLKHLFIKEYFPNIKMLLYDPLKFDIEEDEQIIIKSGKDGWFDDDKIEEVLKIANGRKILYISDIRISDDDDYKRELLIYKDLIKQQKWAVNMGAEFILLKFRLFFYQEDPKEIDFINNDNINEIKDKVIFKLDDKKQKNNTNWMLYLSGKIYSQILAGSRSAETRLFVKKIKYHKKFDNIVKFSNDKKDIVGEKYLLKYYCNINYEELLNYFNIYTRTASYSNDSNRISDYIIGIDDNYTAYTIYYLTVKWFKYNNLNITFEKILEKILTTLTFFYKRYNNNFVICTTSKRYYKTDRDIDKKYIKDIIIKKIDCWNKQIKKLYTLDIDRFIINDYINSHKTYGKTFFTIENNLFILSKNIK